MRPSAFEITLWATTRMSWSTGWIPRRRNPALRSAPMSSPGLTAGSPVRAVSLMVLAVT